MATMYDSEGDDNDQARSRSRSPLAAVRGESDHDNDLSPDSAKTVKLIEMVVRRELVPIRKSLNQITNTTSQVNSFMKTRLFCVSCVDFNLYF